MSEAATQTRQEVVEANIASVLSTYNEDAVLRMICECVKDISVSLAMLVDAGSTNTTGD